MLHRLSTAVAALTAKARRKKRQSPLPWLWVLSDAARLIDVSSIIAALPPGVGIIVRHPDPRTRAELATRALRARRSWRTRVLISQDWRTAVALGCDGVHIPESMSRSIPGGLRLWCKSKNRVLTTSAHGWLGLRRASQMKADLVFLSPVLPTPSHVGRRSLGRVMFSAMTRTSKTNVAALGGVDLATLPSLNGSRTSAVAGVSFAI